MKRILFKSLLLTLPFSLMAQEELDDDEGPSDQVELCLAGTYFAVCKAMTMAQDAGYSFVKIISYDLIFDKEHLSFSSGQDYSEGKIVTFEDEDGKITVACFDQNPEGVFGIEIADYTDLVDGFRILDADDDDDDLDGIEIE